MADTRAWESGFVRAPDGWGAGGGSRLPRLSLHSDRGLPREAGGRGGRHTPQLAYAAFLRTHRSVAPRGLPPGAWSRAHYMRTTRSHHDDLSHTPGSGAPTTNNTRSLTLASFFRLFFSPTSARSSLLPSPLPPSLHTHTHTHTHIHTRCPGKRRARSARGGGHELDVPFAVPRG